MGNGNEPLERGQNEPSTKTGFHGISWEYNGTIFNGIMLYIYIIITLYYIIIVYIYDIYIYIYDIYI